MKPILARLPLVGTYILKPMVLAVQGVLLTGLTGYVQYLANLNAADLERTAHIPASYYGPATLVLGLVLARLNGAHSKGRFDQLKADVQIEEAKKGI